MQAERFRDVLASVRDDLEVYDRDPTRPGFKALMVYRFNSWRLTIPSRIKRLPWTIVCGVFYRWVRNHYGIELPPTAVIGRRLRIVHQGGIVIHRHARIGDDCWVLHGVTVGAISGAGPGTAPTIGDRVQIGAGAIVLGPIHVGDDAFIGPNAVVMMDVPEGTRAVTAPARIIRLPGQTDADNGA